jgi:glycosyltransferase involved in cell wall biosynthesis
MPPLLEHILLAAFTAATLAQLFFWLYFFARLARHPVEPVPYCHQNRAETTPPVSVIICARNEAKNLQRNLHRILNQSYRSFEVIVVNHKSCDNSSNVLSSLQSKHKHLVVVNCDDDRKTKKVALAKGIETAKNQVLLLTDADCEPASDQWICGMIGGMQEKNTPVVLGVAPYWPAGKAGVKAPNPLNSFIRFETCYTAMQYLSLSLAEWPYMGVGRNLAYRRELFHQTGGFKKHEHLASGDDDLFINEVAKKGGVGIRINPNTFVYSNPKKNLREYYRQKTRHFSTGKSYKLKHQILLGLLAMSHLLHYFIGGIFFIYKISIMFALLGYAVRMGVVMVIGSIVLRKLQHQELRPWLPVLDASLVLYYLVFAPATLMNNDTQKWN